MVRMVCQSKFLFAFDCSKTSEMAEILTHCIVKFFGPLKMKTWCKTVFGMNMLLKCGLQM